MLKYLAMMGIISFGYTESVTPTARARAAERAHEAAIARVRENSVLTKEQKQLDSLQKEIDKLQARLKESKVVA